MLAVCIIVFVCSPFSYPKSYVSKNLAAYYDEEEDTVDGVLVKGGAYSAETTAWVASGTVVLGGGTIMILR